jgi:hypothetical protein
MPDFRVIQEEIKVFGRELVEQVSRILHEGNVRRIIIKDAQGHTFLEVPVAVAAVGVIAAPVLAALGALAALVANFTLVVERVEPLVKPDQEKEKTGTGDGI